MVAAQFSAVFMENAANKRMECRVAMLRAEMETGL